LLVDEEELAVERELEVLEVEYKEEKVFQVLMEIVGSRECKLLVELEEFHPLVVLQEAEGMEV
jgi:hypothetical protein